MHFYLQSAKKKPNLSTVVLIAKRTYHGRPRVIIGNFIVSVNHWILDVESYNTGHGIFMQQHLSILRMTEVITGSGCIASDINDELSFGGGVDV